MPIRTQGYDQDIRDAAQALLLTYGFNEEEETTDHKPEFKKNTPSSWEEYKKKINVGIRYGSKTIKKSFSGRKKKKELISILSRPH